MAGPLEATNTAQEQAPETLFPGQLMEIPKYYPRCRGQPVFRGNPEALAWALDSSSTIVTFIGSGAFLGTVGCSLLHNNVYVLLVLVLGITNKKLAWSTIINRLY
jgi:hypothetical protein